jgi:hypothetical protein
MARIFISYKRIDEEFARRLAGDLDRLGADVWIDVDDIPAGMNWSASIQEGLNSCEVMIVVISPESMASQNVEEEWQYFRDEKKPVIPVLLRPARVHYQLRRIQYVDFHTQDYEVAFRQLHSELGRNGLQLDPISPEDAAVPIPPQKPLPVSGRDRARSCLASPLWAGIGGLVAVAALALTAYQIFSPGPDKSNTATPTSAPAATLTQFPTPAPTLPPTGTATPTPTPTATLTPTATPTLTPTVTPTLTPTVAPRPNLERIPALDEALAGRSLSAVAAANGHVWFATRTGLIHYLDGDSEARPIDQVLDNLEALAVESSGTVVWFSSGADSRVGRYSLDDDSPEWLAPEAGGQPVRQLIVAIQIGPRETIWIAGRDGAVLRWTRQGGWVALPTPQTITGVLNLSDMALNPANPDLLWVAEANTIHLWHDEWDSLTLDEIDAKVVAPVNAVTVDGYGRAWFGHQEGVTFQAKAQRALSFAQCDALGDLRALGVALDLATSDAGRTLWIVTRGGLARADISPAELSPDCATWTADAWEEYLSFWEDQYGSEYTDYRLAVDERDQGAVIWVIRRDTDKARRLES